MSTSYPSLALACFELQTGAGASPLGEANGRAKSRLREWDGFSERSLSRAAFALASLTTCSYAHFRF
jgi:hypothetical protein